MDAKNYALTCDFFLEFLDRILKLKKLLQRQSLVQSRNYDLFSSNKVIINYFNHFLFRGNFQLKLKLI